MSWTIHLPALSNPDLIIAPPSIGAGFLFIKITSATIRSRYLHGTESFCAPERPWVRSASVTLQPGANAMAPPPGMMSLSENCVTKCVKRREFTRARSD